MSNYIVVRMVIVTSVRLSKFRLVTSLICALGVSTPSLAVLSSAFNNASFANQSVNSNLLPNFNNGVFGRSAGTFVNFGNPFFNGNQLNLTFDIPQDVAGFSRLSVPRNQNDQRRVLIRDPQSGFVVREVALNFDGQLVSRPTNAFGQPLINFFQFGGIDSEAQRQASKFFLENEKLGDFNNIERLLNGQVNINDAFAANNLAARELGRNLVNGDLTIQCAKDDSNGNATDLLAGRISDGKEAKVNESYEDMDWIDRCVKLVSFSLNHLVDPFHPPIPFSRGMVDPRTGRLTVRGLRNHFSIRDLAIIFARSDNTDLCASDPFVENPVWSTEGLVRQALNPDIYNKVKGLDPDDVNRNLFFGAGGVNLALPKQLLGRIGARQTDLFYINNRDSGVATSQQTREIRAFISGNNQVFMSDDTNAYQSGTKLAGQEVLQSGVNNLATRQSELFHYDQYGRMTGILAGAPDANGKMIRANEAPASAAYTPHAGVNTPMCIKCHDGPATPDKRGGPYYPVPVNGQSGIQNLSSNFSLARYKYHRYLRSIYANVDDKERPGGFRPILWDAYERANLPRSQEYVSTSMGYPPDTLTNFLLDNPQYMSVLNVRKDGNLNPQVLEAGGKCLIKRLLGNPQRYFQPAPQNDVAHTASR